MKQSMQAQAQKIIEIDHRLKKVEDVLKIKEQKIINITDISDHPKIDIKQLCENTFQLTRIEAGSVAFVVIKKPLNWMQLRFMDQEQQQRPQYLYFGFVDGESINSDYTEENYTELDKQIMSHSYIINTSGRARVPGQSWGDIEQPLSQQLSEASKILVSNTSNALDVCIDDGLNINCFTKTYDKPYMVVGIFGEGTVELRCQQQ